MVFSKDWNTKWRRKSGNRVRTLTSPKAAIFFFALFLAFSVAVTGCASRRVIENVVLPYGQVKQTILNHLPGGVRSQSSNGRELTSKYFTPEKNGDYRLLKEEEIETIGERSYAEVVILGERRPYRLDVRVYRQVRDRSSKRFSSPIYDEGLTETFSQALKSALTNRRDDRNLIDDFRAF